MHPMMPPFLGFLRKNYLEGTEVPSIGEVLQDISTMVDMKLGSIRAGADITLTNVDFDGMKLELETSSGAKRSRPFSEVEAIIRFLNSEKVAHVDTVLGGSGSSRNQPETILANLPYIEYTYIDKKKHLVLRDEPTHEIGTLKEVSLLEATRIIDQHKERQIALPSQIIVTTNLRDATMNLVALGADLSALSQSIYSVNMQGRLIWVVLKGTLELSSEGGYVLLPVAPSADAVFVGELLGTALYEELGTFIVTSKAR
jgi:hypothetical protein